MRNLHKKTRLPLKELVPGWISIAIVTYIAFTYKDIWVPNLSLPLLFLIGPLLLGTFSFGMYLSKVRKKSGNKRMQTTLEYLITYGWALMILAMVIGLLYSFGIFNPSAYVSNTVTGFSGFSVVQECINGNLALSITNPSNQIVYIKWINTSGSTGSYSTRFFVSLNSASTGTLLVPKACLTSAGSVYADSVSLTYSTPGAVFPGPYVSDGTVGGVSVSTHNVSGLFAANFNGVNSYMNISSIPLHNGSFTVTAFVNGRAFVEDSNTLENVIVSQAASSCPDFYHCIRGSVRNDTLLFGIIGSDKPGRINMSDNQWYFVSFVYNASSQSKIIYQNGTFDGSGPSNKPYSVPNGDTLIGAFWNGTSVFSVLNGLMANVQVYNTALTQSQILGIYSGGISEIPSAGGSLIAWWPLDGNALDYSGGSYNGVPINVNFVTVFQS